MPNLKTWRDEKNIYSVDMMFAYINTIGHPMTTLSLEELTPQLEKKVWGDWSPMTVLRKLDAKKYQANVERIRHANMRFPILVFGSKHIILDGYHRVAKAMLEGKTEIKAHVFDAALMRKFLLVKGLDYETLNRLTVFDVLELWTSRFCKEKIEDAAVA